jgi:glutathione synthase/RimK-type ligase-like ATP-grasp enzyme
MMKLISKPRHDARTDAGPRVLLATTSCYYPAARIVIALREAGCSVDAICPKSHPLRTTRSVNQIYTYRGLAAVTSFARAIAVSKPDLIISGDDLATRHLHRLYALEQSRGKRGLPVCELIERSLGKPQSFSVVSARAAFMDCARKAGVRVPDTGVIANIVELKSWIGRVGFPVVLKADGTSGGDGVSVAHTMLEAERAFEKLQAPPLLARAAKRALVDHDKTLVWPSILRHKPTLNAQAFIGGREATSTVFCWNGAVLGTLHFEVVNKVSAAGHATVLRLIENAEMSASVETMAMRLGLSGFYGFDFLLEADTQNAYLIEINPRATQVGHLTLGPGRDLPAALYAALTGQAVRPAPVATGQNTIALFPQEWIRDPESAFLHTAYHDVPWNEPELIRDCVSNRDKQTAWYSRPQPQPVTSEHARKNGLINPSVWRPESERRSASAD